MNKTGSLSIFFLSSLLIGYFILFSTNPQSILELGNMPLLAFNLSGLTLHAGISFFLYVLPGILLIFFSFLLPKKFNKGLLPVALKLLILLLGIIMLYLGLQSYKPDNEDKYYQLVIIMVGYISLSQIILLLFFRFFIVYSRLKWPKIITLACLVLLVLLSVYPSLLCSLPRKQDSLKMNKLVT